MNFETWLQTAWTDFLSWFGVEEQKLTSFFYPILKDAKVVIEKDLWSDIVAGVPVVSAALAGGLPAALTAAEQYILPLLAKQSVTLAQTTLNTLYNALVAQAQASLATAA